MYLILDGAVITSKTELHDVLTEQLELPEYYGRNLDALHDCLTEPREPLQVILLHEDALDEHLGSYAEALKQLILDAGEETGRIALYRTEAY